MRAQHYKLSSRGHMALEIFKGDIMPRMHPVVTLVTVSIKLRTARKFKAVCDIAHAGCTGLRTTHSKS